MYAELAALTNISPDDPRAALSSQLAVALGSPEPLSAEAVLLADTLEPAKGGWNHLLHRRNFSLEDVRGTIRQLSLRCGSQVRELQYGDGLEWSVPQSWSDCSILVQGEPGARFRIVEFADRQDMAATD
jgi:hypothetical protein